MLSEQRARSSPRLHRFEFFLAPNGNLRLHFGTMITLVRFRRALAGLFVAIASSVLAQVTELPRTVAPGRLLVRMDGLKLSYDRADAAGNTYNAVGIASTTVRTGLTSTVDLQVGADFFLKETVKFRGTRNSHSGLGDLSFRTKWTFWSDEKSGAAAAVMPYVKLPSGTGGVGGKALEGGVVVPWAMHTGAGVTAGAMFQWDMIRNEADNGYDARWYLSGFAQRDLTRAFSVYGEGTLEAWSTGLSNWAATVGAGVLWRIAKSLTLDYELQRGLNDRAAAWTHIWRANWEW